MTNVVDQPEIVGEWQGIVDYPSDEIPFVFNVRTSADGHEDFLTEALGSVLDADKSLTKYMVSKLVYS